MKQAERYAARYIDVSDLMTALDTDGIESDQDWEAGSTTWTFPDGSSIEVTGSDITVLNPTENQECIAKNCESESSRPTTN